MCWQGRLTGLLSNYQPKGKPAMCQFLSGIVLENGDCPSPNPCTGCCVPSVPRGEDAKSPIGTANVAGYARRGAERPAVILPTPQCSTGTTQSRPYPTRAGKVMESAGHLSKQPVARHHEAKNGSSPGPSGHAAAIFPRRWLASRGPGVGRVRSSVPAGDPLI